MQRETVFVTGVTGSMGGAFMRIYAADRQKYPYKLKVLARDTAKSRRILRPYRYSLFIKMKKVRFDKLKNLYDPNVVYEDYFEAYYIRPFIHRYASEDEE